MAKAEMSQRHQTVRATPAHDKAMSGHGGTCHNSPEVGMDIEILQFLTKAALLMAGMIPSAPNVS